MNKVFYIGLDISTSITGICFLDEDENIVMLDNINLKKQKCMFEKSNIVSNRLEFYKENYTFTENIVISIEEPFQSFSKGFSSANTISQLNKFNGIVSYLIFSFFNIKPVYINVNSARKNLQIKINKNSNLNTKDQIFNWVKEEISFNWPTKIISRGKNKGLVKFDESGYDMSDAYVICRAIKYYDNSNKQKN